MKIIFITGIDFIEQHITDMYVEPISKKFKIELWDLSKIYSRSNELGNRVDGCRLINTIEEFDSALAKLDSKTLIITNILINRLSIIYDNIKKYDIDIATITKEDFFHYFEQMSMYNIMDYSKIITYAKSIIKSNKLTKFILYKKNNRTIRFDYLLSSTNNHPWQGKRFIKIHHVKYDEYMNNRGSKSIINNNYALFLDSALLDHPMYKNSHKTLINRKKYIDLLINLFDYIEQQYDIEVIISSHPKSNFDENIFNGRKIIKYKTPILIENCSFVLVHNSTSIIQAVLSKKPIIFLIYDEMLKSASSNYALGSMGLAKFLKAPLLDLENIKKFPLEINEKSYNKFIYKFLLNTEALNHTNAEIILGFLNRYEKDKI